MPWPTHGLSVSSSTVSRTSASCASLQMAQGRHGRRRTHNTWRCGAPQGAAISPILANVYLYYVFDLWVHRWCLTKASGDMIVIRYADDTIVGFQHEQEARTLPI